MQKKLYDVSIALGQYRDRSGNDRTRWQNVGAIFESDKGKYMLLDRWFNPAGLPNPENRTSAILWLFEPRSRHED